MQYPATFQVFNSSSPEDSLFVKFCLDAVCYCQAESFYFSSADGFGRTFGPLPSQCKQCQTQGCLGGVECSFEYQGELCSVCNPGFIYTPEVQSCIACSNNSVCIIVALAFILFLVTALLVILNSSDHFRPVFQIFRNCLYSK